MRKKKNQLKKFTKGKKKLKNNLKIGVADKWLTMHQVQEQE